MRFFLAVLLIALATATVALNLSLADQISAAKTFFHELTPRLQQASRRYLHDENGAVAADSYTESATSEVESTPEYVADPSSEIPDSSSGDEAPVETLDVEVAAEFRPFSKQTHEATVEPMPRAPAPAQEPAREQPLDRDEVSEVIRRLGRISRAVARDSDGRIR